MYEQQQLPLPEGPGGGFTLRVTEPHKRLAAGASRYASRMGKSHNLEDFANVNSGPSHLATYYSYKRNMGQPPTDETIKSYDVMKNETKRQYQYLTNDLGVNVEFHDDDPYPGGVKELSEDLHTNNRLKVLKTEATGGHSYFTNEENDMFRAVHDAFGHAAIGRSFSRHGEEAAYMSHSKMYSDKALPALASETRGQNSYLIYDKPGVEDNFPDNAVVNMEEFTTEVGRLPSQPKLSPQQFTQGTLF